MAGDSKSIVAAVAEVNDLKDAIADLKKEIDSALDSLNNFGRVGSLSVRNLGSEARTLQSSFRDISREFQRLTTPSGTIGAAATSQALGQLTGRGGGGGGGGGGPGGPQMGFGARGLGGAAGALVGGATTLVSDIAGGALKAVPWIGSALGAGVKRFGKIGGRAGATIASAGMSGSLGFLQASMGRHMGIEEAGRGYAGWQRMMPTLADRTRAGYGRAIEGGPEDFFRDVAGGPSREHLRKASRFGFSGEDIMRATFPMRQIQKPGAALEKFVAGTMLPATTSFGLGIEKGQVQGFAGAMKGAGLGLEETAGYLGGARAVYGQGDARRSTALLGSINTSIGQLVNAQGYATSDQVQGAARLHRALETKTRFAPEVIPSIVGQLGAGGRSPGGGEAGRIAVMQTLGFGMPNLDWQKGLAGRMGIKNPGRYGKRRGFLQTDLKMQGLSNEQAGEVLMLTAARAGPSPLYQAKVLERLAGIRLPRAMELVQKGMVGATGKGGWLSEIGREFKKKEMKDVTGGETSVKDFQDSIKLLKEYHKMINLSLSMDRQELQKIAQAVTKIKIAVLEPMTELMLKLPATIGKIFTKIEEILRSLGLSVTSAEKREGGPLIADARRILVRPHKTQPVEHVNV